MECAEMRIFLFRLLVAAALTLAAFALSEPAHGQQADEDSTPTNSKPQGRAPRTPAPSTPQSAASSAAPSSGDQTQDELAFTGHIEQEKGTLVLKDPVTKLTYQLDDQPRARKFIARQVKVIGKLQMKSNTIQVSRIERIP
jgi:hypothetical protein